MTYGLETRKWSIRVPFSEKAILSLLFMLLLVGLQAQPAPQMQSMPTFHIQGFISTPWDSLPVGVLVPNVWGDAKSGVTPLASPKVTFIGEKYTTTVAVDDHGFYQTDLPLGTYKMTIHGPSIGPQLLSEHVRVFRVELPTRVVLNGSLYRARTSCDVVELEQRKSACGGEDTFLSRAGADLPFELRIEYPQRQSVERGHVYHTDPVGAPDVPVLVTYNLFSLKANTVFYDDRNDTIIATGNVVIEDGLGTSQRADSMSFRLQHGKAILLN